MNEAIDLFEQKCYDTAKARVHQFLGEYHSSAINMMFQAILHYEIQLKELRAPKTCETCVKNKGCQIMAYMFRERLNKEGYAMHRNEMVCLHSYEPKGSK